MERIAVICTYIINAIYIQNYDTIYIAVSSAQSPSGDVVYSCDTQCSVSLLALGC